MHAGRQGRPVVSAFGPRKQLAVCVLARGRIPRGRLGRAPSRPGTPASPLAFSLLLNALMQVTEEKNALARERDTLRVQIEELKACKDMSPMEAKAAAAMGPAKGFIEQINELTGRIKDLTGRLNELTGERNALTARNNELTPQVNVLTGERNELVGKVNELTGARNSLVGE